MAGQHARRMYPPPARTITNKLINGPWDMTAADHGNSADLYVSNLLNGTVAADGATVNHGTVVRIELGRLRDRDELPQASSPVVIGSGFAEHSDPAALVVGPTGLTLGRHATLYVADTAANRISAIPAATHRTRTAFTGAATETVQVRRLAARTHRQARHG